jgi:hypothetical protein
MTIILETAPANIEKHAAAALLNIGYPTLKKMKPFAGPVGVYYCSGAEFTEAGLAAMRPSTWSMFFDLEGCRSILDMDGETGKKMKCLTTPFENDALLKTVTSVVTSKPVIPHEDYLRRIEIPALHIRAVWLKDTGKYPKQDRFFLFGWQGFEPFCYLASDFFTIVADQEKQRLKREAISRTQGRDVDVMGG